MGSRSVEKTYVKLKGTEIPLLEETETHTHTHTHLATVLIPEQLAEGVVGGLKGLQLLQEKVLLMG